MGENKAQKEKVVINIDNQDDAIGWIERFLKILKEYGPWKILGATILLAIVSLFFYVVFNLSDVFTIYKQWEEEIHNGRMEKRLEIGPKIQTLTDKLTYSVDADRVIVLEMHNGNTGSGGLPFTKCSATYESLNIGRHSVAEQYQETNMSLIPFTHYLFERGYWCGDVDDIENIDRGLCYKLKSNGTEHFAACIIEGVNNKAIAFMIVSFNEKQSESLHDCASIREYIRHVAMELAVYLEVARLME